VSDPTCVMHGQPLSWCRSGYRDEHDRDGGEPCSEHQPWCGDPSLSRPEDECTCAITPEMQRADNDRQELEALRKLLLTPGRHQARRGDDVEAWVKRWRDESTSAYGGTAWAALDDMLDDYRLRSDLGTPLDAEVRERDLPARA
jgi:hypothetical protein